MRFVYQQNQFAQRVVGISTGLFCRCCFGESSFQG